VRILGTLGCNKLALDLSRAALTDEGRSEVTAFARALTAQGWTVTVHFPGGPKRTFAAGRKPARGSFRIHSLKVVGQAIVGAERITIRALLLASVLVNSAQFVAFEAKIGGGVHERSTGGSAPNTLASWPMPQTPSGGTEFDATFLRFSDLPQDMLRKLNAEAIENRMTTSQVALSALQSYADRKWPQAGAHVHSNAGGE